MSPNLLVASPVARTSLSSRQLLSGLAACLALAACGDDTTGSGGAGGQSTTSTSTSSTQTGATTTTGVGGQGSTSSTGGGGVGGGGVACDSLPAGPISPTLVTSLFNGSEDLAFDGNGGIVGKKGSQVVRVDANDVETTVASNVPQAYGLRYGSSGDLFVALPSAGKVVRINNGTATDFATGLSGPNGVFADFDGNLWVTEFGGGRVIKLDSNGMASTIVQGQNSPNGVVLDTARNILFFTSYSQGRVRRVDPAGGTATDVGQVNGAALDGLVLDTCGNVYAVDQGNDRLYRFNLDAAGDLVGQPELIADFPVNVANAQFGSGPGFNETSLYAAGNPGDVYEIPVGVTGVAVPTAQ